MNPYEFLKEMQKLNVYYKDAPQDAHLPMDALMEQTLIYLGYEEGIDVFRKQSKYYD